MIKQHGGIFGRNPTFNNVTVEGDLLIAGGTANATTLTEGGVPVVVQTDIGTAPNEIPLNQYLGSIAYQNLENIIVENLTVSTGIQNDMALSTGNLVIGTAGKGIDFSADSNAAGMTSELLDDYEEGTFTPTVTSSSGTLTSVTVGVCDYTKIGRQVTVNMQITITNAGTGSGTLVATLPFTNGASVGNGTGRENALTGSQLQISVAATGTSASILKPDNTTIIATNAAIRATLTYFV
jgi:hypothetical protein